MGLSQLAANADEVRVRTFARLRALYTSWVERTPRSFRASFSKTLSSSMLYTILSIVGGLIAASSFVIAKKPDAQQLFDKLAPYQGFIGIGMLATGVLWLLQVLPHLGSLLSAAPLRGGVTIGALVCTVLVGFVLGYALLSKYLLSKNEAAKEKGAALLVKLARVQVPLGLATVGLSAATLVL